MEEPLELFEEPDDEQLRRELAPGVFTGVYVESAGESLDELSGGPAGVLVVRLIENSPGIAAGLRVDDLLYEVSVNEDPEILELAWPSEWRELELESTPGDVFHILYERAGVEQSCDLRTVARLEAPGRTATERFREELKVGVVVRTATEVEARDAGLGPGGGAVLVGMAQESPWRAAGLKFGDLIVRVQGEPVAHPQVLLDEIRKAEADQGLALVIRRSGEQLEIDAPVSSRVSEVTSFTIPLIFSTESERGTSETSFLSGLIGWKSTPAAWEFRLLWFIRLAGGDADRLKEVEVPEEEAAP
jgi:C-terminal processing protease CtpA/Prc